VGDKLFQVFKAATAEIRPKPRGRVARGSTRLSAGPRFRILGDAIRYVADQPDHDSYAIRAPDGSWITTRSPSC